ncbi:MAG TPA: DUF92 domain-containing protein [Thermoplasmata archaeon]|nr:DUF92 domain-containing protein [Thermoplasmata archaeon]
MLGTLTAIIGILATVALSCAAVLLRSLTPAAGAVAAVFGSFIVVVGGFAFLALLILFVLAGSLATRYHIAEKTRDHLQEGQHGERGISNVLAHIVIPTILVGIYGLSPSALPASALAFLYTAALAFGAADTFASEFGVLAGHARSILSLRPVTPGTNGGVSARGEAWALVGAATTAAIGFLLFSLFSAPTPPVALFVIGTALAGFVGCQIDSVLGETLENRGYLTKGSTNLLGMVSSVLIGGGILVAAGGHL